MNRARVYCVAYAFILMACTHQIPKSPLHQKHSHQLQNHNENAQPILGSVTSAKLIDRLVGYPVCGMKSEVQKQTLKANFIALDPPPKKNKQQDFTGGITLLDDPVSPKTKAKKKTKKQVQRYFVEIECFFFGFQGMYEYFVIDKNQGYMQPLSFDGALKVRQNLNEQEVRSPVALNQGRYEVCGVPEFNKKNRTLRVLCKGKDDGRCGAFALYKLTLDSKIYFKRIKAHFLSCDEPGSKDVTTWPEL